MNRRDADAPVVVIGNGPVGQTTALLLARWGVPSVVLDAQPARSPVGSRSICQQRETLETWDAVGVGRAVADEGVTWETARTFHRERELFHVRYADPGRSHFPAWVNLGQHRVEQLLDERIADCPGIDVRWSHTVTGLTQDEDGVTLAVTGPDGPTTLRAPYVVACCGAHGDAVRAALGTGFAGRSFDDRFLICDVRCDLPDRARERRFHFDPAWNPGRQVLVHACPDSTYRIDWQVPPGFDLDAEEADGGLDARIRQVVDGRDHELVWRSVYRFQSRCADRMLVGRVLLAGDAAHLMAPFGARGLNSGVADAANAAWKLAFVRRGWAGPELLESYEVERHAAALENLAVTTRTMDFLVPRTDEARAHRERLLADAADDPAARAEVDSGRLAEPYWYAVSPITTPDPTRPLATRPARGATSDPAVGVVLPDLPTAPSCGAHRLRELVRDAITVLVVHAADAGPVAAALHDLPARTDVHAMDAVSPELAATLGARPGEAWVVRPDAHVAAIVPADVTNVVRAAVERVLGHR